MKFIYRVPYLLIAVEWIFATEPASRYWFKKLISNIFKFSPLVCPSQPANLNLCSFVVPSLLVQFNTPRRTPFA